MAGRTERMQGGRLAAQAVKAEGVDAIFTLCGGHVMPVYEGCRPALEWALGSGQVAVVNVMLDPDAVAGHPYRGM